MTKKIKKSDQLSKKQRNIPIFTAVKRFGTKVTMFFGVKQRHVLTRQKRLRIRYVFGCFAVLLVSVMTLTLQAHDSNAWSRIASSMITDANQMALIEPAVGFEENGLQNLFNSERYGQFSLVSAISGLPKEPPLKRAVKIEPGDALGVVMEKQGVGNSETSKIISAMKEHYDPRDIRAGQIIKLNFEKYRNDDAQIEQRFKELLIPLDRVKTLIVARADDGFASRIDEKEVKKIVKAKRAEVQVSLYGSAAKAGIPKNIVANAIRIYSWNVDFQRDIRSKDKLEVMYESYETEEGHVAKLGEILYAKLTLGNREIPLYRFEMEDGRVDYFQPDGTSIKRTLMKTPVDGARMSSGFGMRRHPILGYNKMHKGVDFAAPTGTPIYAAGDGVVERAGRNGGYGKYVRIRHNSKLKTAYAHMHRIRSSVKNGARVKQGQVIGYVGSTGRSTGPHLHYEVLLNNKQVNPRSVNLPTGEELTGKEKQKFKSVVDKYRQQFVSLYDGNKVASRKRNKETAMN
jgi:murein DD-endopeptidase MepM/ murein hydrolase activator NlpD